MRISVYGVRIGEEGCTEGNEPALRASVVSNVAGFARRIGSGQTFLVVSDVLWPC